MPITDPAPAGSGIDPKRRDFVRAAVGTGSAAAGVPFAADAAHTDNAGLTTGEVTLKVGDLHWPAWRGVPAARVAAVGKLPVLRVAAGVFAGREPMTDVAPRSVRLGRLAVAPEWFVRRCDAQSRGEIARRGAEVAGMGPDAQASGELDACMPSLPTAGAAITGTRPRTAGSAAWRGSRRMAPREHAPRLPPS